MNIFKAICGLFGGRGKLVYRETIDAGKAVAPVAAPIVQAFLASHGLPNTAEAALGQLAVKAAGPASLTPELASGLQSYVAAHLP